MFEFVLIFNIVGIAMLSFFFLTFQCKNIIYDRKTIFLEKSNNILFSNASKIH